MPRESATVRVLRERVAFGSSSLWGQLEGDSRGGERVSDEPPSILALALRVMRGELSEAEALEIVRSSADRPSGDEPHSSDA